MLLAIDNNTKMRICNKKKSMPTELFVTKNIIHILEVVKKIFY